MSAINTTGNIYALFGVRLVLVNIIWEIFSPSLFIVKFLRLRNASRSDWLLASSKMFSLIIIPLNFSDL